MMWALHRAALSNGIVPVIPAVTVAEGYRTEARSDRIGELLAGTEVEPFSGPGSLPSGTGSVLVGPGTPALPTSTGTAVKSETIIPKYYQTIRTGSGDISIFSSQNILLLNSLATIYTAGTQAPAMAGFETPLAAGLGGVATGAPATQPPYYPVQYSFDGGDVTLAAQNDIAHEIQTVTGLAADSSEEMPTNWLYRRGSLGAGGVFGTVSLSGEPPTVESTSSATSSSE